jgi:F0F1-type ATP synthase membrane subunit b/b'
MDETMGYYDVHAAIDKAVNEERWSRNRHVEDVARDLRAEFRREVMELREEVGELFAQAHETIKAVSDACDAGDKAITRAMDARTGHLA